MVYPRVVHLEYNNLIPIKKHDDGENKHKYTEVSLIDLV